MEPVTHFLTGACLARAGFNRKTAYATLTMTLAAEAPDIDVVWSLGGPVTGFAHHRGMTHTLLGAPLMALVITGLVWVLARLLPPPRLPVRWSRVWLLALVADGSHIFLDWTNNYGLRPFFPFDRHWYAGSFVFIVDPLLLLFLLGGLVLPAVFGLVDGEMRRKPPGELRGRGWALAALTSAGVLWGVRAVEHGKAERLMAASSPKLTRVAAEPSLADPFTWRGLGDAGTAYQTATVHSWTGTVEGEGSIDKPEHTPAVAEARRSYLGRVYGDWSSWPAIEDLGPTVPPGASGLPPDGRAVVFRDLRFAPEALGSLGERRGDVLSGWVILDGRGRVSSQWMNGREQR